LTGVAVYKGLSVQARRGYRSRTGLPYWDRPTHTIVVTRHPHELIMRWLDQVGVPRSNLFNRNKDRPYDRIAERLSELP